VVLVTGQFRELAGIIAQSQGKPRLPILVLPSNIEELSGEELRSLAQRTFEQVAQKLTQE
jgi:hypothetical protein